MELPDFQCFTVKGFSTYQKRSFQTLETLLPPIGRYASNHWKEGFHPLEGMLPLSGSENIID